MKKKNFLRELLVSVSIIAIILIVSCDFSKTSPDSKKVAQERNDEKFEEEQQEKDADFLVNASEINLEEIQLGRLAQNKGTSYDVRQLGKLTEEAHTKSQDDLKVLAKSKMIIIPNSLTSDTRTHYKNLEEKTGKNFDEAYLDRVVKKHKDAIGTFKNASEDSHDIDIKNWAKNSLPDWQEHHKHSVKVQKKHYKTS
ncbi:DUF4142 domain-containing protein [Psychroflexus montanilacus]|uniref:DUF4142 domain-containing protein n=1 Tax=Psychroflexus montanilacus TaxID=2873598 RepID=UPI001CD0314E|nr:DUF4142 domain-containing protein [Psychroflexus montanilacus]MBZ9650926.1 DUF4142 domain-containing protein [Psychroflexus montanilacus]